MGKKQEALDLVKLCQTKIQQLPPTRKSDWIKTEDVAAAIHTNVASMKAVLRRPRIQRLLANAGIAVSFRGAFIYVFRQPSSGTPINPDDIPDDDDDDVEPEKPKGEWDLDPDYFWYPPSHSDIQIAADANMNIFMVGPAGSGKSTLLRRVFVDRGASPMVVSFTGETSIDDIVGCKDLVPTERGIVTEFTEGFLPICMRGGKPLIIDEADATPPDIQFVMHPVLMGEPLLLTKKGAEYVNREIGFLIAATGNTLGRGDDSGLYVGTNVLNEAYIDRYGIVIEHWYMPEQEEMKVLVKRTGIHRKTAENMVKVATLARDAMLADKLSSTFSTRKMLDWANLVVRNMEIGRAFILTCVNKVSRDDKKTIAEFGQRVFASAMKINPNDYTV